MNPLLAAASQRNLVLASASPRRREILERLGFRFEVLPTGIGEDGPVSGSPGSRARTLARRKARAAAALRPSATVIAADTIVVCRGEILGKPSGPADARRMLELLSGRRHEVVTGVAVAPPSGSLLSGAEATRVYFRKLSPEEVERYIETGEPFGKAGAYAIQGYAAPFVRKIEGCYFNVVGLPVSLLFRMLAKLAPPEVSTRARARRRDLSGRVLSRGGRRRKR